MSFRQSFLILAALATCVSTQAQTANASVVKGVNIQTYRIEGNTVLPPDNFGVLSNFTGTNVSFPQLREGLGALQLRYHELGFPTISVALPQQKISNGVVRVKVVEGKLARIKITGNDHFSEANIRRALPSLTTNILLNTRWFQPELDEANANHDRQIYPVISPGYEPGETELELKVKDRLPLHGRVEVNNKSSAGSPLLRLDTAVQYANLWQREHSIGVDYNFSPQRYKDGPAVENFLDHPEIVSYSAFYRMPLGSKKGYREELEQKPVTFGYDEVTHKFNMPPPSGHPELTVYASRSSSDSPLQYGPKSVVFTNVLIDVNQQFVQHSPTINNNIGAKLTLPLAEFAGVKSSFTLGVDWKSYQSQTLSTNLTIFTLWPTDVTGTQRGDEPITNRIVPLAANSGESLFYIPLSIGWAGGRPDRFGSFVFSYNQNIFLAPLASARRGFQNTAGDAKAGGYYTTINAGIIRQQRIFGEWNATFNLNGQWASAPLISNEQFGLGGTGGVRGYEEGEAYGDSGWRALLDLRAPAIVVGHFPTDDGGDMPAQLRCSVFMDYGQIFVQNRPAAAWHQLDEWGTGVSFFLNIGEHVDARLTFAWALLDAEPSTTLKTSAGTAKAYFSVGGQF